MVLVGKEELRQVYGTTGTTGKPTLTFATKRDLDMWAERNGRNLGAIGFRPRGGYFYEGGGYGLATGGFGYHYGAHHINLTVIPTGIGRMQQKLELMEDLKITGTGGSSSFILYMARVASLLGPGMACECERKEGLHVWSDHMLVECIDSDTGEWVPEGEAGELVWTFLVSEAVGIIRYRSGDLSRIMPESCPCGRTSVRIDNVKGRVDGGVSVGGFTIFSSQVEDVLFRFKEVGSNFRCVIDSDQKGLDRLAVDLEVSDRSLLYDEKKGADFSKRLKDSLQSVLGVTPKTINFVEPDSLPAATDDQLKTSTVRIVDRRRKD